MRLLEWLVFLAFVPAMTLSYLPIAWLRRRSLLTIALPLAMVLLHLAIEGWRTHMLPLYLLAGLLPIVQLSVLRGRTRTALRRRDWRSLTALCGPFLIPTWATAPANALSKPSTLPRSTGDINTRHTLKKEHLLMTIQESFLDLFYRPAFAHLATLMADGSPQITPIWVDYDGQHVLINSARVMRIIASDAAYEAYGATGAAFRLQGRGSHHAPPAAG